MTWDERYRQGDHVHLPPMPFLVNLKAAGRVLDVACGAGRHALLFYRQGCDVTAVDASAVALEILRREGFRGQTLQIDLEQQPLSVDGPFELVICTCYLQRDLFPVLRELVRPGTGRIAMAISLRDERQGVKPMNPLFLLEPGELAAQFPGWQIEHQAERWPDPPGRGIAEIVAVRP